MKTNMGRKLLVLWLGLVVAAFLSEIILQIAWRGSPDAMNPQFNYNYLDIYKKVFRKKTVGGKVVYESSRPRMEKQVFSETKGAQTKRIFIIGESTAQQFNIPVLKEELGRVFHGTSFEIVNCGMGAYDAYRTRLIGEEIVHYQPDLVIIIVGNNEFHTTRKVNRFRYQSVLAKSKLFSVLMDLLYPPVNIDNLKDANKYYEDNLRGLFGAMHKNNVPAVICTLPVNYQYYNHLGDGLVPLKALVFNLLYFHFGDDLLVEKMAQSLESQKGLGSFVDYLRGKLHEKKEQYDAAYGFYRSELNSTKFPFSCPPVRNDLIRQIVKQEKIVVADVEKRFVQFVSDGISGFNLFKDNSHVWPSGYRLYTREIINAIDQHNRTADDDILAPIANWQIDNITPLNYSQLLKEIEQDKSGSEHELFKLVIFKLVSTSGTLSLESIDLLKQIHLINKDYLNDLGVAKEAIKKDLKEEFWSRMFEVNPESNQLWSKAYCHMGITSMLLNENEKAIAHFNKSIQLDKAYGFAYLFRGIHHSLAGHKQEAQADFTQVSELMPDFGWQHELVEYLAMKLPSIR